MRLADEILSWYGCADDFGLAHVGVAHDENPPGRGSGRFGYGTGKNPYQHPKDFLTRIEALKVQGITRDSDLAAAVGLTTTKFQSYLRVCKHEARRQKVEEAQRLLDQGLSKREIGRRMGISDKTVESLLDEKRAERMNAALNATNMLKDFVDENGMTNVSAGTNIALNISEIQMKEALADLEAQGYVTCYCSVPNVTNPGKQINLMVLTPPGTPYKIKNGQATSSEVYKAVENNEVSFVDMVSHDNGETFEPKFVKPVSMDPSRLQIVYAENGGKDRDGVIELRRGVKDLDLGDGTHYAQVRIMVGGTHYLKGMAMYSDDLPPGIDVRFNTNKKEGTPVFGTDKLNTILKKVKNDPENPFGALIKPGIVDPDNPGISGDKRGGQSYYYDENGEKKLSLINKVREEGDWESWSDRLPAQFLAKQPKQLIDRQLKLTIEDKQNELKEIQELTNPSLRKVLLDAYAEDCDKAAVYLKAAALPGQKYQVLLPVPSLKDNEVYAPNYEDGSTVALIRYPHGGQFEVAIRKVNNKNREGNRIITKEVRDAIGVNALTAQQLSGADYDGDTAMVIPCNDERSAVKIMSDVYPDDLKKFDAKMQYGGKKAGTFVPMKNTQKQMGMVTNLLTDMTSKGAKPKELIDVVKHTMVVIDAEKHGLDWKQSEIDHNIAKYRREYQNDEGPATIFSRAKNEKSIPKRQGEAHINQIGKSWYDPSKPEGALVYKTADDLYYPERKKIKLKDERGRLIRDENGNEIYQTYIDKNGKERIAKIETGKMIQKTQKSTRMMETDDAMTLLSDDPTPKEIAYAEFANAMKALATEARKEEVYTTVPRKNPDAAKLYEKEIKALETSLMLAKKNATREQEAQIIANSKVKALVADDPNISESDKKKYGQQALMKARAQVGAKRTTIKISDREWEAIQAGALSDWQLKKIFDHTDLDELKQRATPRNSKTLSDATQRKIQAMAAAKDGKGNPKYSRAEIAEAAGVSTSTVSRYM